jgi:hypothetical protein
VRRNTKREVQQGRRCEKGGARRKQTKARASFSIFFYVDEIVLHSRAALGEKVPLEGACETGQP